MKLEKGYDTELSERGGGLSIGQKQLLAFTLSVLFVNGRAQPLTSTAYSKGGSLCDQSLPPIVRPCRLRRKLCHIKLLMGVCINIFRDSFDIMLRRTAPDVNGRKLSDRQAVFLPDADDLDQQGRFC